MRKATLLCLFVFGCQSGGLVRSQGGDKQAPASPTTIADSNTAAAPAAAGDAAQGTPDPKAVAEVEATVNANNAAQKAERDHFASEGWTIVDGVPAPDARLLSFDAAMMQLDPDALRTQLASTTPTSEDLERVVKIATTAQSMELRLNAIEAVGRMRSEASQSALVAMLTSGTFVTDEYARLTIAPLVRPRDLDDPGVSAAAALLDLPLLGEIEKNQIAFTLAAIALRDGTELPDSVLASLSDSAKQRIATMRAVATN